MLALGLRVGGARFGAGWRAGNSATVGSSGDATTSSGLEERARSPLWLGAGGRTVALAGEAGPSGKTALVGEAGRTERAGLVERAGPVERAGLVE